MSEDIQNSADDMNVVNGDSHDVQEGGFQFSHESTEGQNASLNINNTTNNTNNNKSNNGNSRGQNMAQSTLMSTQTQNATPVSFNNSTSDSTSNAGLGSTSTNTAPGVFQPATTNSTGPSDAQMPQQGAGMAPGAALNVNIDHNVLEGHKDAAILESEEDTIQGVPVGKPPLTPHMLLLLFHDSNPNSIFFFF